MRQLWKLINWALIAGTLIGILQPAFFENKSLTQIIVSLLEPELSQGFLMRWLFFIAFLGAAYVLIIDLIYRNRPVTVIRTRFEVRHITDDGSTVEIYREQLLRANRPGVIAYFTRHSPDTPTGRIIGSAIIGSIYSEHHTIDSRIEKFGTDTRG